MQQAPASPPTSPFNVADLRNAYHEDAHHNRDILTNRLTAVIDMSLPVITAVNRNHLVTMVTGYDR